jgi:hypothetical protein
MALFKKKETYNEQMLREAGLDRVVFNTPQPQPQPEAEARPEPVPAPATDRSPEPSDWEVVATVSAPIHGHRVDFTTLPDGDLIVTDGNNDDDFSSLADAIEEHVSPPYQAIATRGDGDVWRISAKRLEVAQFAFPGANALELAQAGGVLELDVDGEPSDVAPPVELQRLGEHAGTDYSVQAQRIDGDYWEIKVSPL